MVTEGDTSGTEMGLRPSNAEGLEILGDFEGGSDEQPDEASDFIVELTEDDQDPPVSCKATQKNAPPLHGYVFARSVIKVEAFAPFALDPDAKQSDMQKPNTTRVESPP